ncbi:50S ribosome-binding GTPase [Kocuria palustris]|nr:50S ribosome-binding GTPase [Kocuria palustris]
MSFLPRRLFPNYNVPLANFKGHHQKALTKFGHLAPQIDLVVEVRDLRAPVSTTNVLFDKVLAHKPKLIVYTKKDLLVLKPDLMNKWHRHEPYMFVDARNRRDAQKVIDKVIERYDAMDPPPPLGLRMMIIGMPNVGKLTLVNTLREVGYGKELMEMGVLTKRKKVAKTGGQPGVTRLTSEIIRLLRVPDILVYDTPGVFLPTVKDAETMLALGLVGCVHTLFIDPVIQADYLLYLLNLQDPLGALYSEYIDHPTNSIDELLYNVAKTRGKLRNDEYDELGMALHWVNLWRQGKSSKYRGLFDLGAIVELNGKELRALYKDEQERVKEMNVHQKLVDSFGEDGTSTLKARKRTAKDRAADLKNQLFKL